MRLSHRHNEDVHKDVVTEWVDLVAGQLGVGSADLDRQALFDLGRYVARDVSGAAAPLTCYLLGVAVGRGMTLPEAVSRVSTLVERWRGIDWRD